VDAYVGEALTRWSVRLAVACYLGRVGLDLGVWPTRFKSARIRRARWLWTAGCVFYLVHVLCAFAFFHAWSHERAYRHTASQTAAVTGIEWGGGLYINYAVTAIWIFDVCAWWIGGPPWPYGRRIYCWTLHAIFAFIVFNATVVFGPPFWRRIALPALAVVTAICVAAHCVKGPHKHRR
jgi:hypothetical protein